MGSFSKEFEFGPVRNLLIVAPSGGLNDVVCELTDAIELANLIDSDVIIRNNHWTGISRFLNDLFVFSSNTKVFCGLDTSDEKALESHFLSGQTKVFETRFHKQGALTSSQDWLDMKQKIITYTGRKGGGHGARFFQFVEMTDSLQKRFVREAKLLDKETVGSHIRHSDYRTEYQSIVCAIKRKFPRTSIFLSTDSQEVFDFATGELGDFVIRTERVRPPGNRPLHKQPTNLGFKSRRELAFQSVQDLLLLGSCNRFLYTASLNFGPGPAIVVSGFSRLAREIRYQAPMLVSSNQPAVQSELIVTGKQVLSFVRHFGLRFSEVIRKLHASA